MHIYYILYILYILYIYYIYILYIIYILYGCHSQMFLAMSTRKHQCWSLFLIKLQAWRHAALFKRDSNTGAFLFPFFLEISIGWSNHWEFFIQLWFLASKPYNSSFLSNIVWSTVSKAYERSINTPSVYRLLSKVSNTHFFIRKPFFYLILDFINMT